MNSSCTSAASALRLSASWQLRGHRLATLAALAAGLITGNPALAANSDLIVTGAVSVTPSTITVGGNATVALTVKNNNTGSAPASTLHLQIKNGALTVTIVDVNVAVGALAAGQSTTINTTVTIPATATPGSYAAYVALDRYNVANQGSNTANDFASSAPFTVAAPPASSGNTGASGGGSNNGSTGTGGTTSSPPASPTLLFGSLIQPSAPGFTLAAAPTVTWTYSGPFDDFQVQVRVLPSRAIVANSGTLTGLSWTIPASALVAGNGYEIGVSTDYKGRSSNEALGYFTLQAPALPPATSTPNPGTTTGTTTPADDAVRVTIHGPGSASINSSQMAAPLVIKGSGSEGAIKISPTATPLTITATADAGAQLVKIMRDGATLSGTVLSVPGTTASKIDVYFDVVATPPVAATPGLTLSDLSFAASDGHVYQGASATLKLTATAGAAAITSPVAVTAVLTDATGARTTFTLPSIASLAANASTGITTSMTLATNLATGPATLAVTAAGATKTLPVTVEPASARPTPTSLAFDAAASYLLTPAAPLRLVGTVLDQFGHGIRDAIVVVSDPLRRVSRTVGVTDAAGRFTDTITLSPDALSNNYRFQYSCGAARADVVVVAQNIAANQFTFAFTPVDFLPGPLAQLSSSASTWTTALSTPATNDRGLLTARGHAMLDPVINATVDELRPKVGDVPRYLLIVGAGLCLVPDVAVAAPLACAAVWERVVEEAAITAAKILIKTAINAKYPGDDNRALREQLAQVVDATSNVFGAVSLASDGVTKITNFDLLSQAFASIDTVFTVRLDNQERVTELEVSFTNGNTGGVTVCRIKPTTPVPKAATSMPVATNPTGTPPSTSGSVAPAAPANPSTAGTTPAASGTIPTGAPSNPSSPGASNSSGSNVTPLPVTPVGSGSSPSAGATTPAPPVTTRAPFTLRNVSTRVMVAAGSTVIVGFVVDGGGPALVRVVGPGLRAFGVTAAHPDPRLEVYSGGTVLAANDNWGGTPELMAAFVAAGAFGLDAGSKDAAVVLTLPPGAYTAQVTGVGATSGEALVEVYRLP